MVVTKRHGKEEPDKKTEKVTHKQKRLLKRIFSLVLKETYFDPST